MDELNTDFWVESCSFFGNSAYAITRLFFLVTQFYPLIALLLTLALLWREGLRLWRWKRRAYGKLLTIWVLWGVLIMTSAMLAVISGALGCPILD